MKVLEAMKAAALMIGGLFGKKKQRPTSRTIEYRPSYEQPARSRSRTKGKRQPFGRFRLCNGNSARAMPGTRAPRRNPKYMNRAERERLGYVSIRTKRGVTFKHPLA